MWKSETPVPTETTSTTEDVTTSESETPVPTETTSTTEDVTTSESETTVTPDTTSTAEVYHDQFDSITRRFSKPSQQLWLIFVE
ncbi:unnamed protein product [Darwinula stevensoni]|uniref:Uncharacterized protein n=1 Tax=Darwinula stevensoni TaxID=69355 RepID=A0A7R9AGY2_9CRUS|nr:unnamed protein product [Darwinula stevensoni]CAG0904574.1 unnamed protein product [Darwinula stevensoni]